MINYKFLFTNFLILIMLACSPREPISNRYISKKKNIEHLISQGRKYWGKRVSPMEANKAMHFISKAYELDQDNKKIVTLYSEACHFIGHYFKDDPEESDSLFKNGMNAAWNYIINTESFKKEVELAGGDSSSKIVAGIENINQELAPLIFWYVANYSRYIVDKPVMNRIKHRDLIETSLHRILSLRPDFYYHGANRIFGAVYARMPGVPLRQSVNNYKKSIKGNPNFLGTYVSRAQYLHTKSGQREQFIKDLRFVLNADPTILPAVSPENLLEQEKAKNLLARELTLFE